MEIILSKNVKHLSGSLGQGFGYFISPQKDKNGNIRFFSQRSAHGAPKDGHLKFIFACAELAQMGSHIADISVNGKEVYDALKEAGIDADLYPFDFEDYNAKWVLNFKRQCFL